VLKTPNFTNKTASIIWMLILALALVLVDYFLSPVVAENDWMFQKELKVDKISLNTLACEATIKEYLLTDREKIYIAKACLKNSALVLLKESKYKGELLLLNNGMIERIATNLHSPNVIKISSKNEIFIREKGRDRVLKFYKNQ